MPVGEAGFWDRILETPPSTWIMYGTFLLSAIPVIWAVRKDSWQQGGTRRKEQADLQRQAQADLRTDQQNILDWHKSEVVALRKQVVEVEADRDKQVAKLEGERDIWEARARWWYRRAQELLDMLREARHLAMNCSQIIANLIAGGVINDPGFAELSDETPKLPARIESIEDRA